jgi:hypothetical protein
LTSVQPRQLNDRTVGELQRIMMDVGFTFVDVAKERNFRRCGFGPKAEQAAIV